MIVRRASLVAIVVAGAATAGVAHAQTSVAEQLYRDGQQLIATGKTHEACLKFAESHRAEPALGTLVALAACHEREQKFASAWAEFKEASELAEKQKDALRADFARTRAAAVEKRVYRVRVELIAVPAGVSMKLGDKEYGEGAFGSWIPLDPGQYTLSVSAPGRKTWLRALDVAATGKQERIEVTLPLEETSADSAGSSRAQPRTQTQDDVDEGAGRRITGFAVGGAGLLLGITAAVLEVSAASKSSQAVSDARAASDAGNAARYDAASNDRSDALGLQTIALVAGGIGIVAIGVGAYLLLTSPSSKASGRVWPLRAGGTF
jgi:hypothetical protein